MTDLEMTKLCAEAMGFPNIAHELSNESVRLYKVWPDTPEGVGGLSTYDPLHDDAQAMALAKKFGLWLQHFKGGDPDWHAFNAEPACEADNNDLNRAIVECVATMQAAKMAT